MNSIILQRQVQVFCWRVVGQIAKAAKRPELLPVLLRSRENGTTNVADIAEHLLFEPRSRKVVAERLLHIAELYGLLEERDRAFALTPAGEMALDKEEIFVPEQGAWTIWACKDPLLPSVVLQVKPWSEPTANAETRREYRNDLEERRNRFESLQKWLLPESNDFRFVILPDEKGGRQRVNYLEPNGEKTDPAASLRAVWDVVSARLRLEGDLDGVPISTALDAPSITTEEVWKQLLESDGQWSRWDQRTSALRVGFDETDAGERESMSRNLTFQQPRIMNLGSFDAMTVERVPLRAQSAYDAKQWAEWRLHGRVRDYATAERFAKWVTEAVQPLIEFQPSLTSRKQLAGEAWKNRGTKPTPTTWNLVAAEDWSL